MDFLKKLYQLLFVWKIPAASDEELRTADAIVTQAFSRMKNGDPGPGNQILAEAVRKLHAKYGLPIMAQEEVGWAIPELECVCTSKDPNQAGLSTPSWNTYEVAKIQVEYCKKRGWKKVILVTSLYHMGRSAWVYRKLGMEVLPAAMPVDGYFNPGMIHWWSGRSKWHFQSKEVLVRLLFWYWGYI